MIAAIMQPTYLPWIGYFDLMDTSDFFVLLDTVQFEKQAWQQRNRIKTADGQWKWLTAPVIQNLGQRIDAVKIDNSKSWPRKHWGTIEQCYRRAPYWQLYSDGLSKIYTRHWDNLVELNLTLIKYLKDQFGIKTDLFRASELPVFSGKVRLLIEICHYLKVNAYISPVRAANYIEQDNIFESEGISLVYQQFEHPVYAQMYGEFISHMSAIDLLFNEGPKSLEIIRSGRLEYDLNSLQNQIMQKDTK